MNEPREILREERLRQGLTQWQLAERVPSYFTGAMVSGRETGMTPITRQDGEDLSAALGVNILDGPGIKVSKRGAALEWLQNNEGWHAKSGAVKLYFPYGERTNLTLAFRGRQMNFPLLSSGADGAQAEAEEILSELREVTP